jgi:hypothetical protein
LPLAFRYGALYVANLNHVQTRPGLLNFNAPHNSLWSAETLSSSTPEPNAPRTYNAAFLAASTMASSWVPRIFSVRYCGNHRGTVYTKERTIAGLRTGLVYGDAILGNLMAASESDREAVLLTALEHLLRDPGVMAIRLSAAPDGPEMRVVRKLAARTANIETAFRPATNHHILPLAPDYPTFLESLGGKTRRNFRYYRRKFEDKQSTFIGHVEPDEFTRAAQYLHRKKLTGANRRRLRRALAIFSAVKDPILTGLRSQSGEWLALLGGWNTPEGPVVFMQMNNDREYPGDSLCTVLRSYVIERAIAEGAATITFWAGVGGPLSRYAYAAPTTVIYIDKTHLPWRILRRACVKVAGFLPASLSHFGGWLVPSGDITFG